MMTGRDMAGCLPLALMTLSSILSGFFLPSMHGAGLGVWFGVSLSSGIAAVGLLAYARLPLYRQGEFLAVGPNELPPERLRAYRWAWRFVALTVFMQLFLLLKLR